MKSNLTGKKIGIPIATGFLEEQVVTARNFFVENGAAVDLIAVPLTQNEKTVSSDGTVVKETKLLSQVKADDLDAFILAGVSKENNTIMRMDELLITLVIEMDYREKVIAGYHRGANILYGSGILYGKRVFLQSEEARKAIEAINAIPVQQGIVIDRNVITVCAEEGNLKKMLNAVAFMLDSSKVAGLQ